MVGLLPGDLEKGGFNPSLDALETHEDDSLHEKETRLGCMLEVEEYFLLLEVV